MNTLTDDPPKDLHDYFVQVVDDTYINSGISPMNSIVFARQRAIEAGCAPEAMSAVLLDSMYADVPELNLRGVLALF